MVHLDFESPSEVARAITGLLASPGVEQVDALHVDPELHRSHA